MVGREPEDDSKDSRLFTRAKDMSLQTDLIFIEALRSNADLMRELPTGDVYDIAVTVPDTELVNAPLPQIIVQLQGVQNDETTKDDDFEGDTDSTQVSIEIAAKTRQQLAAIARQVRTTVRIFMAKIREEGRDEDAEPIPKDYTFSAGGVSYDPDKPCYWQILNYNCETENT